MKRYLVEFPTEEIMVQVADGSVEPEDMYDTIWAAECCETGKKVYIRGWLASAITEQGGPVVDWETSQKVYY